MVCLKWIPSGHKCWRPQILACSRNKALQLGKGVLDQKNLGWLVGARVGKALEPRGIFHEFLKNPFEWSSNPQISDLLQSMGLTKNLQCPLNLVIIEKEKCPDLTKLQNVSTIPQPSGHKSSDMMRGKVLFYGTG
ncbi:hypothetical protein GDO81_000259 [Engystomops pustulosus]|uniref:Uncharacterized protein n=1 Tax=Engystomops pustulosus TaxID=76066 RepID=A0AAV7D2L2_ENGPU|nr:hypothetical protein GDO81_000259 [Engystomops pustulosus]